jgi:hypothetical protein
MQVGSETARVLITNGRSAAVPDRDDDSANAHGIERWLGLKRDMNDDRQGFGDHATKSR